MIFRRLIAGADFTVQVLRQLVLDLNLNFELLAASVSTVSAGTTVSLKGQRTVYLVDTTAGNVTLTLPPVRTNAGKFLTVKKLVAANTLTLDPDGTETIDGAATLALTTQWATRTLYCTEEAWFIVAN